MKKYFLLSVAFFSFLQGDIITPFAENLPKGKSQMQEYYGLTDYYGWYTNSWKNQSVEDFQIGEFIYYARTAITDWLDVSAFLFGKWNFFKDASRAHRGDSHVRAGFQLCREINDTCLPSLSIAILQTFPTGKYDNLSPSLQPIDWSGEGTYRTMLSLHYLKSVNWLENHPIRWIVFISYSCAPNVSVHNFHFYGGGFGTKGTIHPYKGINAMVTSDISLSERWVFDMTALYEYTTKVSFTGNPGNFDKDIMAINDWPASHRLSVGASLGYLITEQWSVGAEVYTSILGRNNFSLVNGALMVSFLW
jgi:hypothetical protein